MSVALIGEGPLPPWRAACFTSKNDKKSGNRPNFSIFLGKGGADRSEQEAVIEPYSEEEREIAQSLVAENLDVLLKIAREQRQRSRLRDTMLTGDLLQEALLRSGRKVDWSSRSHFLRAMALAMRHVIIDRARGKLAQKRGEGVDAQAFEEENVLPHYSETPEQLVAIGQVLARLNESHPRWVQIIDARYFMGMTEAECADLLGLSSRTVRREWQEARKWLAAELEVTEPPSGT